MALGDGNSPDLDAIEAACRWQAQGLTVALSVVAKTWGSSPRPVGSVMATNELGQFAGSVSGGCVEPAVLLDAKKAMAAKRPVRTPFGVSDDEAWTASLACGGDMEVLTFRAPPLSPLKDASDRRRAAALVIPLEDAGDAAVVVEGDASALGSDVLALLERGETAASPDGRLFVLCLPPKLRIVIVGATHIGQALADMANLAGFDVAVVDPRRAFNDPARFPGKRHFKTAPKAALTELGLDRRTALVTLTHMPEIDDKALEMACDSPCFYIGALGSRKTHAARLSRLQCPAERVKGPVGLDIGAKTAGEIAVAILAQVVQAWRKGENA